MKNLFFIFISIYISTTVFGQSKSDEKAREMAFYSATSKWFSAWKLVSKNIYQINKVRPLEFVF